MKRTKDDLFRIAMNQSALDMNCAPSDFLREEPVITAADWHPEKKKYYGKPIACNMVSYGANTVASVTDELRAVVTEYVHRFEWMHCFETPNLHWLGDRLAPYGQRVCFMAEYFLPDPAKLQVLPCDYPLRVLTPPDFAELYRPEWSNALCEKRKELDVLGVGAYDGDRLIGLAACSADCAEMRQIGIDVLPEYRRRGVASALTSRLTAEILDRGFVPFYCAAWSNIRSVRNAIRCGFVPAWAEMTVKPTEYVDGMNEENRSFSEDRSSGVLQNPGIKNRNGYRFEKYFE